MPALAQSSASCRGRIGEMRILRTYILREHLGPFLVTLGGLTAVLLVGNIIKFAELVIAKGVSFFDVLRLLLYLMPYLLSFTIPMATLVAMVLAFGRLSSDYELIAMRASGIGPSRLIVPILTAGVLLSMAVLALNDRAVPRAHLAFRRQLKAIGLKTPTAYLEAGTFIKEFTPYVIFVYQIEGTLLSYVRIYEPQPNGPTRTIVADRGEFQPLPGERGVQLKLYDGAIDELDSEHPGSLYKVSFGEYTMTLALDPNAKGGFDKKLAEMTFRELLGTRRQMAAQEIDTRPIDLQYHRRIASSFAPFIFTIFGISLGIGLHHHERLVTFVWVLGVFMAYYLATIGANAIALKGWVPAWLGMWMPNFIAGIAGLVKMRRALQW